MTSGTGTCDDLRQILHGLKAVQDDAVKMRQSQKMESNYKIGVILNARL